jgi:multiple sugar transport system ATP-binding protein
VIGIRPEGFKIVETDGLKAKVEFVETIGRDTTLIIKHPSEKNQTFRAIVDADNRIKPGDEVTLTVKPHKMYIFNKETGELV